MGWSSAYKPKWQGVTEFLVDIGALRWSNDGPVKSTVLDGALVNLSEYYAAIERIDSRTGQRDVVAMAFIVRMSNSNDENFSYKGFRETEGPLIFNCPEKIMKLLTSTSSDYANAWRKACQNRIDARKSATVDVGTKITMKTPVKFNSGVEESIFIVDATKSGNITCYGELGSGPFGLTKKWLVDQYIKGEVTITKNAYAADQKPLKRI